MKKWMYLIIALVIGALVLGACAKTVETKEVVTKVVEKATPTSAPGTQPVLPNPTYCADKKWAMPTPPTDPLALAIEDYVIVVGPTVQIDELYTMISGQASLEIDIPEDSASQRIVRSMCPLTAVYTGADLGPLPTLVRTEVISLTYMNDVLDSCEAMPQHKTKWHEEIGIDPSQLDWAMELWKIEDTEEWFEQLYKKWFPGIQSPPKIVPSAWVAAAINCTGAAIYQAPLVFADPTYRTGRIGGNPWTGEGGPWTGEGGKVADPAEAPAAFWEQWALQGEHGIGISQHDQGSEAWARRPDLPRGDDVIVGVFDSEPFGESGVKEIGWIEPPLRLDVEHLELLEEPEGWLDTPLSNHGLYVAGLIHGVAPSSDIHLYRVLDKNLKGDLWALNVALDAFIREALQMPQAGLRNGAVINLSLGGRPPNDYALFRWQNGIGGLFGYASPDMNEYVDVPLQELVFLEVASLRTLLSAAYCYNMVVVAAAGNDSYDSSVAYGAQIPGNFAEFIAVEANDSEGVQTCFSNQGDVAAPGGGSMSTVPCSPTTTAGVACCEPALDRCPCEPEGCTEDCPYGLVSLVLPCGDYPSGYAYWAGTSFSAPLVSGLAALVSEAEGPWADPDVIVSKIMDGTRNAPDANLANGIIDVPCTVLGEACP